MPYHARLHFCAVALADGQLGEPSHFRIFSASILGGGKRGAS